MKNEEKKSIVAQIVSGAPYYLSAVTTGFFAVGFGKLAEAATSLSAKTLQLHPFLFLFLCPVFFLAAWAITQWQPAAAGSGIPQVKAAVELDSSFEKLIHKKVLGLRIAIGKVMSGLMCLLGGGIIGREGPTVHIAACIFEGYGRFFSKLTDFT
ncbi:MAG: chloride channel protein [Oligoflexales bacterium]